MRGLKERIREKEVSLSLIYICATSFVQANLRQYAMYLSELDITVGIEFAKKDSIKRLTSGKKLKMKLSATNILLGPLKLTGNGKLINPVVRAQTIKNNGALT